MVYLQALSVTRLQAYSNGLSEVILGKAIKQHKLPRDEIVVMTKVLCLSSAYHKMVTSYRCSSLSAENTEPKINQKPSAMSTKVD